ncbi:NUDIX domain-containing protein [Polynucleobacter paneuropaeus]|jgi:ADP-ribose pyrophosphatase|uniref:GDP-mannose pyrophosphatase n=1 Tax=Polynucleobacter paneuropaeus TaxID=2527775 RepID=A0A2Z4JSD6_9BURK|nr:NUDIX hydrolase [Polynucleobacter paneuropaeus]AWW44633.1 ADP-ribose pyrophosphatase [Polynucleobacter paneuropaeus]AWW46276.1 ADP-ribose pyrophosphatase [Polynucleobacter paneuropaeus]AWW48115.1 ADP-ribose pyrophosphatase [Polynucleobacter paneuropaeus]AWW49613.1 ADP-ribose pyrophosphatase [Polynucleobacter paneuropaeus]MBT8514435.1 NUDIX hydrolase [Polynucleobacter paneuropaeus]
MTEKSLHDLPPGDQHLREERISGEDIYGGIFLNMKRDRVSLPDGQEAVREYLTHPGAVAILALLDDGRILLERQYRYPIAKVCMEIPAGKLDPNEDPLVCAQRELEEETGYSASKWSYIRRIHPVISYSTEFIDIYLAEGLQAGKSRLDEEEFLDVFAAPLDEILAWVEQGVITDVKTTIAIYWLDRYRRNLVKPSALGS